MQPVLCHESFSNLSDQDMARQIVAGDRAAFTAMMRRFNQTLYRTARSILRDEAEAEDAVQEAYLHAYRAMAGFRAEAALSTWLVRIVVNESIGRLRKQTRRAEVIQLSGDSSAGTHLDDGWNTDRSRHLENQLPESDSMSDSVQWQPEENASRAEIRRLIEAGIDQLPAIFRTVFMLRAVEEMSVEETSVALGIAPATVRTRYFRARSLLRESLACQIDSSIDSAFSFAGERCDRIVAGVLARLPPPT